MAKEVKIHLDAFVEPFSFPHGGLYGRKTREIERERAIQ